MSLFRHFLREYLHHRAYGHRRRHHRPYWYGGHRSRHPFMRPHQRRRTRVHVGGCCLPIPLGVLLATTAGGRLLLRRRRRHRP